MTSDRGQALVEFALVLPLLLAVTFAVIALAQLGVARLALEHAAAEGARIGALTNDDALVRDTVAAAVAPLDAGAVAVEIEPREHEPPRTAEPRGSLLTVRLRTALRPLPYASAIGLDIVATAVRRIEWTP